MDIVDFTVKAYGNFLEIIPKDGFLDDSTYEIRLKNVYSEDGEELNETIKICTKLTPLFVDIQSVKSIIDGINIPDDVILYHIREASRFAEYIKGYPIDENNVPFEVTQFVKYKAAHESLLRHMVDLSSSTGISGKVGEVSFSEKETTRDISKLLQYIKAEFTKWIDDIKGYKMEGRAQIQSAVKSSRYSGSYQTAPTPAHESINLTYKRGV